MNTSTCNKQDIATDVSAMVRTIKEAQRLVEWTLIAPDGRVWITDHPAKLIMVLAPHNPIFKGKP